MDCSTPGFPVLHCLHSLLKFMSIESMMLFNHLILCCPLLLLPSIFPSVRVFSNGLALRIKWPKNWRFSFSICPSNEYSGLISFRMDWFNLLTIQGTLKSLFQHHSSKASILWHSAFFMVQLSHPYMTTGKTIALTRRTLVALVSYECNWSSMCRKALSVPFQFSSLCCSLQCKFLIISVLNVPKVSFSGLSHSCISHLGWFYGSCWKSISVLSITQVKALIPNRHGH